MKTWEICWILPSLISLIFSLLLLLHLILLTSIKQHIFPQLYALISLGDIFQCISCFLSCQYRLLFFQYGVLLKSFSSLWSILLISFIIIFNKKFTKYSLWIWNGIWIIFPLILSSILYQTKTWEIFCDHIGSHGYTNDLDNYDTVSDKKRILYGFLFIFPIFISIIGIILLSIINIQYLPSLSSLSTLTNHQPLPCVNSHLLPLIRRLQWYPIITAICSLPGLITTIELLLDHHIDVLFLNISACLLSLNGTFISLLYLYYTYHYSSPYSFIYSESKGTSMHSERSSNQWNIGRNGGFFQWSVSSSNSSYIPHASDELFHDPPRSTNPSRVSRFKGESSSLIYHLVEEGNEEQSDDEGEDVSLQMYFPNASIDASTASHQFQTRHHHQHITSGDNQYLPSMFGTWGASSERTISRNPLPSVDTLISKKSRFHSSDLSWEIEEEN